MPARPLKSSTVARRKQCSQNTQLHSGTSSYPSAGTLFAGCHVLVAHGITDCCETSRRGESVLCPQGRIDVTLAVQSQEVSGLGGFAWSTGGMGRRSACALQEFRSRPSTITLSAWTRLRGPTRGDTATSPLQGNATTQTGRLDRPPDF